MSYSVVPSISSSDLAFSYHSRMTVKITNPDSVVSHVDVKTNKKRSKRKQKKNKKRSNNNIKVKSDPHQFIEKYEIEYVTENIEFGDAYAELKSVIEKFNAKEAAAEDNDKKDEEEREVAKKKDDSDSYEEANKNYNGGVSNKKKKLQRRMKIAELKQLCVRPDVVEVWDTTAADPKLLVFLKSYRNTVPVPRHWCQKRKFLHGKRGIEKKPFQLPGFIAATGIAKIRQAYIEKEDSKNLKLKQRDCRRPKMGKMDIDYQVLHDAFFKYQTKPKLTSHGELYYEGKEFEEKLREMKPGMLSQDLRKALGTPEGAHPQWLINMQRYQYGPSPFYRNPEIPGLNAPIPPGASFCYHPGGWDRSPVDGYGRPLHGDVFGMQQMNFEEEHIDRSKHWGDLEDEVESDEEEKDIPEEDLEEGTESICGYSFPSTPPIGVETPDVSELRKPPRKEPERQLYHVLEEKEENIALGTLLGTTHTYVVGAAKRGDQLLGDQKADIVDVNILPGELEGLEDLDGVLAAKYEEAREEEKKRSQREDFSDMVAENEKKRKRKMHEKDGK